MEKKNKQDIVDQIIERMKSMDELPYKEGSWENFQRNYDPVAPKRNKAFYWAASAAAILLLGFFVAKNWSIQESVLESNIQVAKQDLNIKGDKSTTDEIESESILESKPSIAELKSSFQDINPLNNSLVISEDRGYNSIETNSSLSLSTLNKGALGNHSLIMLPNTLESKNSNNYRSNLHSDNEAYLIPGNNINNELAYNTQEANKGKEPVLKNRQFNLKEKFDLGLFVSPNSTNEKFNFGGGLLLAFNVNKHLSVRTGLAYNKYDVSIMKDPVANAETPVVASKDAIQKITANGLTQQYMGSNALVLPNVNAITGNVQALEIPLDIRVKSKDGFYASSGITYAAVFNQNRYTHYVENANSELFGNGLPENETDVKTEVQQISRAIKTEDENVNTNGFGGFVNFSIGKEMKMNKNLNISVEPYLKLPVGSFKRADMNYTNGGIRIITNF